MESISIIIPTFNEYDNIKKLLPFLNNLPDDEFTEIIIVDASTSSDGLQSMQTPKNVTYHKSNFSRRSAQLNEGANLATSSIFLFLHADVIPPDNYFRDIWSSVKNGCPFGFFSYTFDKNNILTKVNEKFTKTPGIFSGGGDQCHFMTKEVYTKLGGYDTDLPIMEDFDFKWRATKNDIKYTVIDNPAVVSSRKYKNNSYIKVNIVNLMVFSLFALGINPTKLKKMYTKILH